MLHLCDKASLTRFGDVATVWRLGFLSVAKPSRPCEGGKAGAFGRRPEGGKAKRRGKGGGGWGKLTGLATSYLRSITSFETQVPFFS